MVNIDCMVPSGLRLFEDSTCSHRLGGLPSPSDSPSLLHLRTLLPQRHVASFWQGTVEPQPPPHANSVVAWPIARQGFYGGQSTIHPVSNPFTWSESLPSYHRNRLIRRPRNDYEAFLWHVR